MVHCQDRSNPPSRAPPLVLGTLLPHFISGKFSRLLAQTQGRISRRRICVRSSLPATPSLPQCRLQGLAWRRWGPAAIKWPPVHAVPLPGEHGAAQLSSWGLSAAQRRHSHCHTARCPSATLFKERPSKHAVALRPVPIAFPYPQGTKQRHVGKQSGWCPPPLPPSCPGLRPEGLTSSSNLICFRSQATQIAFVRLKNLS